ncbi:GumC family protein [Roseibium aquae]|nr:GumC family protein [Roseibium aquae]
MRDAVSSEELALDLGGLLRALARSFKWLLPLVLIAGGATLFALQFVPAKYKGEARILIETKDAELPGTARGVEEERALLDNEGVASQVQLLVSADLARRVAKRLDLAAIAEFDADREGSILGDVLNMIGLAPFSGASSQEERVLKHFFENLDVYRLDRSRVIAVDYSAQDADLAANVANAIVDEYLALQSAAKRESTQVAASALAPEVARLQGEVQAARKAVEDFRARADLLVGTDNITLNQRQLAEISSEVSAAQADKAEAQAKADLIRELLNSGGSLETASDVLQSPLIQRLREQQVAIQSNIAELSITLLPNHPQLRALQSQLADYNRQILSEARKVLQGLENDARVANERARALETRLSELKQAAARSGADQVRLAELERNANAKAQQLDAVLARLREADTRLRAEVIPADARIVSSASVPVEPYAPKVIGITVVVMLVTFLLGCAVVLMRAFLSGEALQRVPASSWQSSQRHAPAEEPPLTDPRVSDPPAMGAWGGQGGIPTSSGYSLQSFGSYSAGFGGADSVRTARMANYVADMADAAAPPVSRDEPGDTARPTDKTDDPTVVPSEEELVPQETAEPEIGTSLPDLTAFEGCVAVVSIGSPEFSHNIAFAQARSTTRAGGSVLLVEIFPAQSDPEAAEGFSDLVAGRANFAQVIYRDAESTARIIEAGRLAIPDHRADDVRFERALDAMVTTHEVVIVDLGGLDESLVASKVLDFADLVVLVAGPETDRGDLLAAAQTLAEHTGARIDILSADAAPPRHYPNGSGRAA